VTFAAAGCLWLAVPLMAACTTALLSNDPSYPAGWPRIIGAGPDCENLEGTFENRGVFVNAAGQSGTA
jgi:hypothetical protein